MLTKQAVDVSFAQGLDTKTDPKRLQMGRFRRLENMVFQKGGLLLKRAGYPQLSSLPNTSYSYLTTFNNDLTAIGTNIAAYNIPNNSWVSKGFIQPLSLSTLPIIRNNLNQTAADSAVAPNGLVCTVYLESDGTTTIAKYVVADSTTGQNIVAPTVIPVASGTVTGGVRVFVLGNYFILVFTNVLSGPSSHLQYVAVSINDPSLVTANTDIASGYTSGTHLSWDGYVVGNRLYLAYNTTSGSQRINVVFLTQNFILSTATSFVGYAATMISVTADTTNITNPVIYISFYTTSSTQGYTAAVDKDLNLFMNPVSIITSGTILNITSAAQDGSCFVYTEVQHSYASPGDLATHFVQGIQVTPSFVTFDSVFSSGAGSITASSAAGLVNGMTLIDNTTPANIAVGTTFTISGTTLTLSHNTAGNSASSPGDAMTTATVSSQQVIIRSVGLASKAFIINRVVYFLSAYSSSYQPTYFLIDGFHSRSSSPVIVAKLAYENGGGYLPTGLPSVTVTNGTTAQMAYLFKDLIAAVNKGTAVPSGTQVNGIYSQTGINLATFAFGTEGLDTVELGHNLHLTGGFLSMYDGYLPVEHNFFLWPDTASATPTASIIWSTTGGAVAAQPDGATNTDVYWYQITYEWTDNQGNAFRSAPSIPVPVTTTGSGTSGSITLTIPSLRLTMKTANPVKIVVYRWSIAQQIYYQTTSITAPTLNDTTVDAITFVDVNADATILGNNILYTTGGVVEDVNAPASNIITNFDSRLWLVNAEDPDTWWYSKQVIEATPVEMSDLFTIFVPPTTSTQGSTGPITAGAPLDDKIITFKRNAILYINGTGPDNTGANSQYSQAIFITSTVGCPNQKSIVLTPQGLMFESDKKGIWLLDRGLNTSYIGAPVEDFTTGATVNSAVNIPESNQILFTLSSGITLMYDYFYGQWGTFVGVPAISSCIFEEQHTFINDLGAVYQQLPGTYLDGSEPVLMSFKTGPLRLGDLQGYMRAKEFFLLGDFISPCKIQIGISYDYSPNSSQSILIQPTNYSTPFGSGDSQSPFGQGDPFGGPSNLLDWRVFFERQRCMAFALEAQEIFDATFGTVAGAGFTLSGLNLIMMFKKGFRPQSSAHSVG